MSDVFEKKPSGFVKFLKINSCIILYAIAAISLIMSLAGTVVCIDELGVEDVSADFIVTILFVIIYFSVSALAGRIFNVTKEVTKIALKIFLWLIGIFLIIFGLSKLADITSSHEASSGAIGLAVVITLCTIFAIFLCVKIEYKRGVKVSAGILVIDAIVAFFATHNIPEFIRAIKGPDFLGIWAIFSLIIIGTALITGSIISLIIAKRNLEEAKNKIYADGDLMILSGFNRFRLMGYYLLKARLHGIVKEKENNPDDESGESSPIAKMIINPDISEEEQEKYFNENPQVKKIAEYINTIRTKKILKTALLSLTDR